MRTSRTRSSFLCWSLIFLVARRCSFDVPAGCFFIVSHYSLMYLHCFSFCPVCLIWSELCVPKFQIVPVLYFVLIMHIWKKVLSQRGAPRARASWRRGTTGREERSANTVSTPTIVFTCNWNWLHCNEKTFYSLLRKSVIIVLRYYYGIMIFYGTMVSRYNGIIKVLFYYPEKILFAEAENGGSKQREKLVVRKVFKII